jgi:hypothetical protein
VLTTVFGRIENFFRRLETYVEVTSTAGMTDIMVKIMVEVLSILSIATKEIIQSRASEFDYGQYKSSTLTCGGLGKYAKKLIGRTDIGDALGRLDRLVQDEGLMAGAQGLKATHEVDDKVQAIEGAVHAVDDNVKSVEGKVQGVDDRVRDVDDKIGLIIDGV